MVRSSSRGGVGERKCGGSTMTMANDSSDDNGEDSSEDSEELDEREVLRCLREEES